MGASGERVKVSEGKRLFELLRGIGLRPARGTAAVGWWPYFIIGLWQIASGTFFRWFGN